MALLTLGDYREKIEDNPFIKKVLAGPHGTAVQKVLDDYFPTQSPEVAVPHTILIVTAIECGAVLADQNKALLIIGGLVSVEIMKVVGFEEEAEALMKELD